MDTLTAWDAFIGQYVTIPRAGYVLIAFAIFLLGVVACKLFRDRVLLVLVRQRRGQWFAFLSKLMSIMQLCRLLG